MKWICNMSNARLVINKYYVILTFIICFRRGPALYPHADKGSIHHSIIIFLDQSVRTFGNYSIRTVFFFSFGVFIALIFQHEFSMRFINKHKLFVSFYRVDIVAFESRCEQFARKLQEATPTKKKNQVSHNYSHTNDWET